MEYPTEVKSSEVYRVSADTNFTIKGWIFAKPPASGIGTIFDINTNYVSVDDIDDIKNNITEYTSPNNNSSS